jgi:hypothetical protein
MSTVGWALVGVAAVVVLGLLVTVALGAGGALGDGARRLGQRLGFGGHVYRGTQLPEEVPEAVEEGEDDGRAGPRPPAGRP